MTLQGYPTLLAARALKIRKQSEEGYGQSMSELSNWLPDDSHGLLNLFFFWQFRQLWLPLTVALYFFFNDDIDNRATVFSRLRDSGA